jgi:type IV pilus assembly protein PilA
MIVVAIIGILAAIAIPNFLRYQLRSRAGERRLNLEAIFKSEEALRQLESSQGYASVGGVGIPAAAVGNLRSVKAQWVAADIQAAQTIDWIVQGNTYGVYGAAASATFNSMSACGITDIDDNDENAGDVLWNPSLAADGTVAVDPPAACANMTDQPTVGTSNANMTLTFDPLLHPMGRPHQVSENSVF